MAQAGTSVMTTDVRCPECGATITVECEASGRGVKGVPLVIDVWVSIVSMRGCPHADAWEPGPGQRLN